MTGGEYDAVVVGSGPNGLAAAITLAQEGCAVLVLEAADEAGGGLRSSQLTLPGFVHDDCASILPLAAASPFFRCLPLAAHGLRWLTPPAPLAHPLGGAEAVLLERSPATTAEGLGVDGHRYLRLMAPLVRDQEALIGDLLGPMRLPRRPLAAARFGLPALLPAAALARGLFREVRARSLLAGLASHSLMPLERPATSAFALMLGMLGHTTGWPLVEGGSQSLAKALTSHLADLGGAIETGRPVESVDELPPARLVFLDVTPRQLVRLAGHRLSPGYRRQLERYRYGPGVCKVDYALDDVIPWSATECRRAASVHLGGTLAEIAAGERSIWRGRHSASPFVLLAQQSLFDPTRAPPDKHTAWAYCHVPHGSNRDVSAQIDAQIERFAPGFGRRVLARHVRTASELEAYNPNYVGGDINGGVQDLGQLFTRPVLRRVPYATSRPGLYLCSSSTPPGGGVHGLCGYHAARAALRG
ncbi:MAG: NAD(P)/FAD-dependent oxidoreductase [Trueperaceae bacterium]